MPTLGHRPGLDPIQAAEELVAVPHCIRAMEDEHAPVRPCLSALPIWRVQPRGRIESAAFFDCKYGRTSMVCRNAYASGYALMAIPNEAAESFPELAEEEGRRYHPGGLRWAWW